MSCQPIASGGQFLGSSLTWLDCAGRQLGAGGYQTLAAPGSPIFHVLLALLTLFIALIGLRLMFGRPFDIGDATLAAAKVGIVLMLATSWPAVRTLVYDTTVRGPGELILQLSGAPLPLAERLQRVDSGIVALTSWGTGKLDIRAGRTADGQPAASAFTGMALSDNLALGGGRLLFLVGVLGSLGLVALAGGALIALLPLFAGFLLFDRTRGIFWGWARATFLIFVAGAVVPVILVIETAMLEPWLARVISERSAMLATPSAPIELLALSLTFFLIVGGSIFLISKACFSFDPVIIARHIGAQMTGVQSVDVQTRQASVPDRVAEMAEPSRAARLGSTLEVITGRATALAAAGLSGSSGTTGGRSASSSVMESGVPQGRRPAGSRRTLRRVARSSSRRDQQ